MVLKISTSLRSSLNGVIALTLGLLATFYIANTAKQVNDDVVIYQLTEQGKENFNYVMSTFANADKNIAIIGNVLKGYFNLPLEQQITKLDDTLASLNSQHISPLLDHTVLYLRVVDRDDLFSIKQLIQTRYPNLDTRNQAELVHDGNDHWILVAKTGTSKRDLGRDYTEKYRDFFNQALKGDPLSFSIFNSETAIDYGFFGFPIVVNNEVIAVLVGVTLYGDNGYRILEGYREWLGGNLPNYFVKITAENGECVAVWDYRDAKRYTCEEGAMYTTTHLKSQKLIDPYYNSVPEYFAGEDFVAKYRYFEIDVIWISGIIISFILSAFTQMVTVSVQQQDLQTFKPRQGFRFIPETVALLVLLLTLGLAFFADYSNTKAGLAVESNSLNTELEFFYLSHPVLWIISLLLALLSGAFVKNLIQRSEQLEFLVDKRTKELSDTLVALKEAMEVKELFLTNMSHELRTPLNGVSGMAQILADNPIYPNEVRQKAKVIHECSLHMAHLFNDFLDATKLQSGMLTLYNEPCYLAPLISELKQLFAIEANKKDIVLSMPTASQLPFEAFVCDKTRLRQILFNLLSNAIKFTHHGSVSLNIELLTNQSVKFTIDDTGIGIATDKLNYIFERFTQADETTTRNYGGTGLGLHISHALVAHMGGSMGVVSKVGKGSSFWFVLPMTPETVKLS